MARTNKKKKKRKKRLKTFCVEYEYTGFGQELVQAENEEKAEEIAMGQIMEDVTDVEVTEVDEEDLDGQAVLDEHGNYI